jgi:hypothetical protein
MLTDHVSTGSATGRYGLDWYCGLGICGREASEFGYAWYGHDAGFPGSTARLKIVPSRRVVVAAVSNTRSDLPLDIVDEILDVLLPELAEKRERDPSLAQTPNISIPLPPGFTGTWRGTLASAEQAVHASLTIDHHRWPGSGPYPQLYIYRLQPGHAVTPAVLRSGMQGPTMNWRGARS